MIDQKDISKLSDLYYLVEKCTNRLEHFSPVKTNYDFGVIRAIFDKNDRLDCIDNILKENRVYYTMGYRDWTDRQETCI